MSPDIAMAEAKPVCFLFGDFERFPPPKKDLDRVLLTERMDAASESFCFGERKLELFEGMAFVVKLLVIVGTGWTGEVGDSTKGSLGEEETRFSFDASAVNEGLLARFERALEGCGEASVA